MKSFHMYTIAGLCIYIYAVSIMIQCTEPATPAVIAYSELPFSLQEAVLGLKTPSPITVLSGAERVTTLKVLGVLLNARFTMTDHVSQVLNTCSSSMFALRLLRTHGLQSQELHLVARATTIASILYATPAWWGFVGERDRLLRLERLIARMRRRGYLPSDFKNIASLAEEADRRLFKSIIQCQTHVLHHLFIDKPTSTRSLRVRAHNFILPLRDNRNFVSRVLYEAICPPPDCA